MFCGPGDELLHITVGGEELIMFATLCLTALH